MLWYKGCLVFLLCLLTAALAGIWGNTRMPGQPRYPFVYAGKEKAELMLDYMKNKYGEDFVDEEAWAGQIGKAYTMRRMHSISCPEESVLVRTMGEEEVVFQDNYLACLLREEIEERLRVPAEEAFGECKVFYRIPELVFPPDFPADMEVDAFLRHPLSMVRIYVYARNSHSDRQGQLDAFLKALAGEGYVVGGVVSYPAGEEMYEMITADNFMGACYQGYVSREEALFSTCKDGGLFSFRWREPLK